MTDLPDPPWPGDIDLGVFAHVEIPCRLLVAPCFIDLPLDLRWLQMRLVVSSWHDRPAGSLSAHPAALTQAAGLGEDVARWSLISDQIMQSWCACSDDRVYFLPMADVIAEAWARRTRRRKSASDGKAKQRLRDDMVAVGVHRERLDQGLLSTLLEAFRARGGQDLRGVERRAVLIRVASDAGLLPGDELGQEGVADARLVANFNPQRGGTGTGW